jgi:hypothetical protein
MNQEPDLDLMTAGLDRAIREADQTLARRVMAILHTAYPNYAWRVEVPPRQGMIIIRNLDCDPRGRYGFALKRSRVEGALLEVFVRNAGGEYLERYRVRRAAYDASGFAGRVMVFERPDS